MTNRRKEPSDFVPIAPLLTWVVIAALLGATGLYYVKRKNDEIRIKYEPANVAQTLNDLSAVNDALKRLTTYVTIQQIGVRDTAEAISKLREEKGQMEKALSIDRSQLDAFLAATSKGSSSGRWLERAIGFVAGTLSSLLATLLYERVKQRRNHDA